MNVENQTLTISGERKEEQKEEGEKSIRAERKYGSFYRTIPLPDTARVDEIEATFESGELKIRIPKAETSQARRIQVK